MLDQVRAPVTVTTANDMRLTRHGLGRTPLGRVVSVNFQDLSSWGFRYQVSRSMSARLIAVFKLIATGEMNHAGARFLFSGVGLGSFSGCTLAARRHTAYKQKPKREQRDTECDYQPLITSNHRRFRAQNRFPRPYFHRALSTCLLHKILGTGKAYCLD
jgi:hypothetical protein